MSLSQPLALFGLLLIPLLIVLHLWRAQHRRQVVSSTWLWAEALAHISQQPTRRLPLRDPLLLLQLLTALALTALLVGPTLARPTHVHEIVVLDASIGMTATDVAPPRFAQARARLLAMLDHLGSGDSLSLVLAGSPAHLVGTTQENSDLAARVRDLQPTSGPADLAGAASLARGLAATPGLGIPTVTFLAAAETPVLPLGSLPVQTVRYGTASLDDQSVRQLQVRCQPVGQSCEAFARLGNGAAVPRSDTFAVWEDNQLLGRQAVTLPARGSLDLTFAVAPGGRVLRLALQRPDAVPADNIASALLPSPPKLQVLLVSNAPGPLLQALQAIPGLAVHVIDLDQYQDQMTIGMDLVVMNGIMPNDNITAPLLLVDPSPNNLLFNVHTTSVFLPVQYVDAQDPLAQDLDLYSMAGSGERIDTPAWAHVVVGGSAGPLLAYGVQDGERTAILPLDLDQAPFTQDVAFPLLIDRLVRWLTPAPPLLVAPGTALWLPPNVQAVQDSSGAILNGPLVQATEPGVYRVAAGLGGRAVGDPLFAVLAAAPGDASPATSTVLPWAPPVTMGSFAQLLWPLALLIVLFLLCGEWWFYARHT
jgi:Ca-activated chloride channel family protein